MSLLEARSHIPIARPVKTPKKRRKWLRKVSKKLRPKLREYAILREEYLAIHPYCQVWLREEGFLESDVNECGYVDKFTDHGNLVRHTKVPPSTEIHHTKGRGPFLNDKSTWLAVCRPMHEKIHNNPAWARERGYLNK